MFPNIQPLRQNYSSSIRPNSRESVTQTSRSSPKPCAKQLQDYRNLSREDFFVNNSALAQAHLNPNFESHNALVSYPNHANNIINDLVLEQANTSRDDYCLSFASTQACIRGPVDDQPLVPTESTAGLGQRHSRPRQEPKVKRQTKEKQRRAARQPGFDIHEQRPKRCLLCRLAPGNRGCFNYPLCDRCVGYHQGCMLPTHLHDQQFLNWRYWLKLCQILSEASRTFPAIRAASSLRVNTCNEYPSTIILEFVFADRLFSETKAPHTVAYHHSKQDLEPCIVDRYSLAEPRAPAIDSIQLDEFIKTGIWGESLWNDTKINLQPEELSLWTSVRLFIGYFAMMHNLSTTMIQSSDLLTTSILGSIIAEMIYAMGFRLQMLYFEIIFVQGQYLSSNDTLQMSPAVKLYSYEVIYRLLETMQQVTWIAPSVSQQHPLAVLQQYFNQQIKHIMCQLALMECRDSAALLKHRAMQPCPAEVEFARSLPSTSFPRQLVVTAARHRDTASALLPCSWQAGDKYRAIDVLSSGVSDVTGSYGSADPVAPQAPQVVITGKNRIVELNKLLSCSPKLSSTPNSTIVNIDQYEVDERDLDASIFVIQHPTATTKS